MALGTISRNIRALRNVSSRSLFIQTERTPNENALKFMTEGHFGLAVGKTFEFSNQTASIKSPLALRLFELDGVTGVLIANDFITVSKGEDTEWRHLKPQVFEILTDFIANHKPMLAPQSADEDASIKFEVKEADKEVVAMICDLLNSRIRPSIQEDGGDLEFVGYEDGVVKLKLQGSCKSCSSSLVTLKMGIERMLMHYIPEVRGVERVMDENESAGLKHFENFEQTFTHSES